MIKHLRSERIVRASVIVAHPYKESLNRALFETLCSELRESGVEVYAHDLYTEKFDPLITVDELGKVPTEDPLVQQYTEELLLSDLLVFIHPNWWGQPPAILKGYIDRVYRSPHAYDFPAGASGGGLPVGKLKGKFGVVFNTANTPDEREQNYFGDPLQLLWEKCIFGFCGIEESYRRVFTVVADSTFEERQQWLAEARTTIGRIVQERSSS